MSKINFIPRKLTIQKTLPFLLLIAGTIGLIASFALTYDKIQIIQDPAYQPSCNINPIFSCGSVMKTEQANLLGVPNTLFGIVAFTALATIGFMMLSGARFKRWLWILIQLGAILGVVFMHYLFFQGVYRIGAICPWCFLVWMITIPTFVYITVYNISEGNLKLPKQLKRAGVFIKNHHIDILTVWYLTIFGILLYEFWYYWSTLI